MSAGAASSSRFAQPYRNGRQRCPDLSSSGNGLAVIGTPPPPEPCKIEHVLYPEKGVLSLPVIPSPFLVEKERPE